ncbi:MAG: holo-ACP synthase [Nitratiruptor sp.]|nr:holo-ACP synthase [Nitratiruptor sp.]NPA83251.1 holo-ACP synthase [Campylobacterota bacterium]
MEVGVDIVAIGRIQAFLERFGERALKRYLNPQEHPLAANPQSAAGLWAAKEAIAKALKCGIGRQLSFHDIELYKDEQGAPHFRLLGKAAHHFPIKSASLSIAHDGGFAIAVAAIELASPSPDEGEKL